MVDAEAEVESEAAEPVTDVNETFRANRPRRLLLRLLRLLQW